LAQASGSEDGVFLAKPHRPTTRIQTVTDFDGVEQDRCGITRPVSLWRFLSGPGADGWASGLPRSVRVSSTNLTRVARLELRQSIDPHSGVLADGAFVTFWVRKQNGSGGGDISIWAVPTLGGSPSLISKAWPSLTGPTSAPDSRTTRPGPGDPLFVSDGSRRPEGQPIFTAPTGLHSHFPLWAPDGAFIYLSRFHPRTNWTSGASHQPAGPLNGSRRTIGA